MTNFGYADKKQEKNHQFWIEWSKNNEIIIDNLGHDIVHYLLTAGFYAGYDTASELKRLDIIEYVNKLQSDIKSDGFDTLMREKYITCKKLNIIFENLISDLTGE